MTHLSRYFFKFNSPTYKKSLYFCIFIIPSTCCPGPVCMKNIPKNKLSRVQFTQCFACSTFYSQVNIFLARNRVFFVSEVCSWLFCSRLCFGWPCQVFLFMLFFTISNTLHFHESIFTFLSIAALRLTRHAFIILIWVTGMCSSRVTFFLVFFARYPWCKRI